MHYLLYFICGAVLAAVFTPLARYLGFTLGFIDAPRGGRKIHQKPTPLLGGLSIMLSVFFGALIYIASGNWDFSVVPVRFIAGVGLGALLLLVGGLLDDKYELPAGLSWLFPAAAAIVVLVSGVGVGIKFITNPFGGNISLYGAWLGVPVSGLFMFAWLMGMTYTTKILDGLDGLAAGVGLIASLVIFTLSLTDNINQPITATLAIVLAGALLAYLFFAFNPASIFLGESGSTFLGWFLGVLAILTGAKIATAVLVMGIPILDVAWSIVRRLAQGKSPFQGDRKHLHFRLLDAGLTQKQAVLVFYAISLVFGFSAVALQSMGKLIALGLVVLAMAGLIFLSIHIGKAQKAHSSARN